MRSVLALGGVQHTSLLLFPKILRADSERHPYVSILENIGGAGLLLMVTPRLINSSITDALVKALRMHKGLEVLIIVRDGYGPKNLKTGKRKLEIDLKTRALLSNERCSLLMHNNSRQIHSKYLLFSGKYKHPGETSAKKSNVLWTGTMNGTSAAHHWEQIIKTTDPRVFNAYRNNFAMLAGLLLQDEVEGDSIRVHRLIKQLFPIERVSTPL